MIRKHRAILSSAKPSVESEPVTIPVDESNQDSVIAKIDKVETDISYLPGLDDDIYVDTVTPTVNEYAEVEGVVKASMEGAGLSADAAMLLNIFSHSRGVPVTARISTESAGTVPRYETRVALEGVREVIRDWWNKFVAWLNDMRKEFVAWVQRIFSAAEEIKASASSLKERAPSATPGSGDIEFAKKAKLLIGGRFPDVGSEMGRFASFADAALVETLENTYTNADEVAGVLSSFNMSGEGSVENLVNSLGKAVATQGDSYSQFLTHKFDNTTFAALINTSEDVSASVLGSDPFFGDVRVIFTAVSVNEGLDAIQRLKALSKAVSLSHIEIVDMSEEPKLWSTSSSKTVDDKKVPRCDVATAGRIADAAISIADAILKGKSLNGKVSAMNSAVDAAGKAINNLPLNEDTDGGDSIATSLRTIVSSVGSYPNKISRKIFSLFGATTKVALAYASASIAGEVAKEQTAE